MGHSWVMRCRAWLDHKARFCANSCSSGGLFCHVHCSQTPFPARLSLLPATLLHIIRVLLNSESVHMLRCVSHMMHDNISAKSFVLSKEYMFFASFFKRKRMSGRMLKLASVRFENLSSMCQDDIEQLARALNVHKQPCWDVLGGRRSSSDIINTLLLPPGQCGLCRILIQ